MYNKKEKDLFLRYLEQYSDLKTIKKLLQAFAKTEPIERYLDKDLAFFNNEEMKIVLKGFGYTSVGSVKNLHTLLKKYIKWRKKNSSNPTITKLSVEDYEDCVKIEKAKLITEAELETIIQQSDSRMKFMIQALREGLRGPYLSEILLARVDNIKKEKIAIYEYDISGIKYIRKNKDVVIYPQYTRTIQISDTFVQYAKMSSETEFMLAKNGKIHGKFDGNDTILRYQIRNNNNLKCKFSEQTTVGTLISRCSVLEQKMIKSTGFTANTLFESALCHAIKIKAEKEKTDVFSLFLPQNTEKIQEILLQYNITIDDVKKICKKYLP